MPDRTQQSAPADPALMPQQKSSAQPTDSDWEALLQYMLKNPQRGGDILKALSPQQLQQFNAYGSQRAKKSNTGDAIAGYTPKGSDPTRPGLTLNPLDIAGVAAAPSSVLKGAGAVAGSELGSRIGDALGVNPATKQALTWGPYVLAGGSALLGKGGPLLQLLRGALGGAVETEAAPAAAGVARRALPEMGNIVKSPEEFNQFDQLMRANRPGAQLQGMINARGKF